MKIAVALDNGQISAHFGRCAEYALYDVENGKVIRKSVVKNPGHSPGFLPQFLGDQGVNYVIAGGMGPRAHEIFERRGITVVTGIVGNPDEAVERFLAGSLGQGQELCDHQHSRCTEDHDR
ncbi:MAG TPA: dinitrogenase iron-molybdenum cofactor [Firmicutes bacterium]|nr:dinitrogenase iron-molybdenum cofactor [Candidatus Fermentithermobacillaceae bacterium]